LHSPQKQFPEDSDQIFSHFCFIYPISRDPKEDSAEEVHAYSSEISGQKQILPALSCNQQVTGHTLRVRRSLVEFSNKKI
jgi:hypothetical protein